MTTSPSKQSIQPETVLPANLSAEKSVLGAIIEDDDLIMPSVIASELTSSDFCLSEHRRIFDVLCQLWQEHKHIDLILVTEALGNRPEDAVLVAGMIQGVIVHRDHILEHVRIVQKKAQLRRLLKIAEWLELSAQQGGAEPSELAGYVIGKLKAISGVRHER
jgi:replicative DNA helicase